MICLVLTGGFEIRNEGLYFQLQVYGAVVRVLGILIHGRIEQVTFEVLRGRDVIDAPAFVIGAGVGPVAPPRVLVWLRMKRPERINIA